MEKVPAAFRAITRTAICRFAMERGHSVISSSVIDQAVAEVMPEHAARAMGVEPAQTKTTAQAPAADVETWLCRRCGRPSRGGHPDTCPVCDGTTFQRVDKEAMIAAATKEGDIEEEEAFDGFKVKWTAEAKEVLNRVPKGYERRRVKARIEKIARIQRLPSITRDFADTNLDEAYGPVAEVVSDTAPPSKPAGEAPLIWTDEAVRRMERVPGGFMRMMARTKVEEFARKIRAETITGDVAEGGLVDARMMMNQALKGQSPELVQAAMQVHGHHAANGDEPREPAPGWTEDGVRRLNEVEIRAEEKFEPSRARELAQHAAEPRDQDRIRAPAQPQDLRALLQLVSGGGGAAGEPPLLLPRAEPLARRVDRGQEGARPGDHARSDGREVRHVGRGLRRPAAEGPPDALGARRGEAAREYAALCQRPGDGGG
jgi:hypothetical protein